MKITIQKEPNEVTKVSIDGQLEGPELPLLDDISYHLKEIVKKLDVRTTRITRPPSGKMGDYASAPTPPSEENPFA